MIACRLSDADSSNPALRRKPREEGESNCRWLARVLKRRKLSGWVALLGGVSLTHFRLRVAQSHARNDLLPSFWSHALIVADGVEQGESPDWRIWEVSLEPAAGFGDVPANNGLQEGRLSTYDDPRRFPNIACLNFRLGADKIEEGVNLLRHRRSLADIGELIVDWLAFAWGVAARENPLLQGKGIPAAAFVEGAFALGGVELTPGLSSRSSCPEAIWQAAKWWHNFYESDATVVDKAPEGVYAIGQECAAVTIE